MWKETTITEKAKIGGRPHYREQILKHQKG